MAVYSHSQLSIYEECLEFASAIQQRGCHESQGVEGEAVFPDIIKRSSENAAINVIEIALP